MASVKTTADLLADVRARVAAPASNGLLSSSEILALADQEMRTELGAMLIDARSEYWVTDYTTPVVEGQALYYLPNDGNGLGLRDVTVYDPNGREYNVAQIPQDQRYIWTQGQTWATTAPFVFCLENRGIVLLPTPQQNTSGWTLRLRYYRQPSTLCLVTDAAFIYTVNGDGTTLTVEGAAPAAFSNANGNALIDVVSSAQMHPVIAEERFFTNWSGGGLITNINPPLTDAQRAQINSISGRAGQRADYVCVSGTTVFAPIPDVLYPVLVGLTCRAYCEAIGDTRGMQVAASMVERKKELAMGQLVPRVDGEIRRPIPLHTPLRAGRTRRRWGW